MKIFIVFVGLGLMGVMILFLLCLYGMVLEANAALEKTLEDR